ncbi:S41 family peptidase [Flavihumibacter stibioxidans]|nr:S41 family peptidase [Flavihumibacter stibioxidans]
MKNMLKWLLLLMLLPALESKSQHIGKKFPKEDILSRQQVENLAVFAEWWGFLKYFHPAVVKGHINWDSVAVDNIPGVLKAERKKDLDKILTRLYNSLPPAEPERHMKQPSGDSIFSIFSLKDIEAMALPARMKSGFGELWQYHSPDTNRKATVKYKQHTLDYPLFIDTLYNDGAADASVRLLGLFRYWNIIRYFYPHKEIAATDWIGVLKNQIPSFYKVQGRLEYGKTVRRLSASLHDSHSFVNDRYFDSHYWGPNPPFTIAWLAGKYVISEVPSDSVAKEYNFRTGDIITSINGSPVQDREAELSGIMGGSNDAALHRMISGYLLNVDSTDKVNIQLERDGEVITTTIKRYPYAVISGWGKKNSELWKYVADSILYVRAFGIRKKDTLPELLGAMNASKGVVMDLRGYPDFNTIMVLQDALLTDCRPYSFQTNWLANYPGFFRTSRMEYRPFETLELPAYKGKLIVLVDANTGSLPESVAASLSQRPATLVLGSQTAGATGNMTWVYLPGNLSIGFTAVGERSAGDRFVQRKGVKIDLPVGQLISDLRKGEDTQILAAVRQLQ